MFQITRVFVVLFIQKIMCCFFFFFKNRNADALSALCCFPAPATQSVITRYLRFLLAVLVTNREASRAGKVGRVEGGRAALGTEARVGGVGWRWTRARGRGQGRGGAGEGAGPCRGRGRVALARVGLRPHRPVAARPAGDAAGQALAPGRRKRGGRGGTRARTPEAAPSVPAPRPPCRGWPESPEPGPAEPPGGMGVLRAGLCPGLTQDTVLQLRSRGVRTVVDLASADLEAVAQTCGLSYKALVALRRVLLAQFSAFPSNGADLYEELKTSTAILSTGIGSLDKLLDAGLYTGEVTEIVGGPGSGKTQVCLCVAANVAYGLQQNVVYIDSNGGLTASRILQLLQARTPDEEVQAGALQRIQVVRAFDIFQMLDVLQDCRGTLSQQVTNHMTRDRDSGELKPALGRSWSFVPSTRILLDIDEGARASGSWRRACLTKSPRLPTGFQEMVDIGTWGPPEQSPASQGDQI
uniref:Notchless homolog 1 n=2 Tax=Canis lupus familiaris TaxID=9615 RepID=A0A8C0S5R2_CANLF